MVGDWHQPHHSFKRVGCDVWCLHGWQQYRHPTDIFDDVNGTHPLVLAQNEGLVIENRVLNVTSYGVTWYIDLAWCETTAY